MLPKMLLIDRIFETWNRCENRKDYEEWVSAPVYEISSVLPYFRAGVLQTLEV